MYSSLPYEDYDIKTLNIIRLWRISKIISSTSEVTTKNQALAAAARIQSIPTLFFITKNGDIERVVSGLPYSYLRHLKDRNDMNPVAVRLLNQQLVAPQFSDPAEVVSYMGAIQAQDLPYNSDLSDILCLS